MEQLSVQPKKDIFINSSDRLKLHGWNLPATIDPVANVIIIHGMKDYSERYIEFAEKMAAQGINVFGIDLRGHAQSEGERVYFESNEQIMDDLKKSFKTFKENDNGKPWFLFGHSAGGSLTARFVTDNPEDFDGFILSAPLLKRSDDINFLVEGALRLVNRIAPHLKMVDLKDVNFSKDLAVIQDMRTDPLIHNIKIPARTAVTFIDNVDYVMNKAASVKLPFLCLHSELDKINVVDGSKDFFAKTSNAHDKQLKIYKDLEHDLFHEPEHARVEDDVMSWLKDQLLH